jgi:hypothetical protein
MVQLPMRDAAAAATRQLGLKAEEIQTTLPDGQFTSATYRGRRKSSA